MADAIHKVTLANPLDFPADQRVRAGVTVTKAYGYEGPLSDEQLEAISADEHLTLEEVKSENDTSKKSSK